MALHLIKLGVGVPDVEWLERRVRGGKRPVVHTRMTPKRSAEVEDGGSLFWVVKGTVACRQPVAEIRTVGQGRAGRCEIVLEPTVIRTAPLAKRPFQGWRYFDKDVPPDLSVIGETTLPDDLVRELRELGAW